MDLQGYPVPSGWLPGGQKSPTVIPTFQTASLPLCLNPGGTETNLVNPAVTNDSEHILC